MQELDIKEVLSSLHIFSFLEDDDLNDLVKKFNIKNYTLGSTIINKGSRGTKFYIIFSGHAKVVDKKNDEEIVLAQLKKGEFFGERSIIKGESVSSTIKASSDVMVLELSKKFFLQVIEENKDIKQYVENFLFNRAVYNFLRKFSVFGELSPKDISNWLKNLHYDRVYKKDEYVFKQGDIGDKFYIIIDGECDVSISDRHIVTLKKGDFFGELAIINNKPRSACIKAKSDLKLVYLSKDIFKKMYQQSPSLAKKINTVIEMYNIDPSGKSQSFNVNEDDFDFDELEVDKQVLQKAEPWDAKPKRSLFQKIKKQYPFVDSYDKKDSVSACIAMICRYYGKHLGLSKIKDITNVNQDVNNITHIAFAAEQIGFNTKPIEVQTKEIHKKFLPAIAMMKNGKYFVIWEADNKSIRYSDPHNGSFNIDIKEFDLLFSGYLLKMEPTMKLEGVEDSKVSANMFISILSPYKSVMVKIFLLSFLVSLFGLAPIIFIRVAVDNILVHQNDALLTTMLSAMLMVGFFLGVSVMLKTYLTTYLSNKVQMEVLGQFFKHIMSMTMKFFSDRQSGDIMSRFNENSRVQNMISTHSVTMLVDVLTVIIYIIAMFSFHVKLAVVMVGFILLVSLVTLLFTTKLRNISKKGFAMSAQSDALLIESITGAQTIKVMNADIQARWKWEDIFTKSLKLRTQTAMINGISGAIGQSLRMFAIVILLFYGSYLVMQGEMTVGQVMAFNILIMMIMGPVQKILGMWSEIQETIISVERLNDVYDIKAEEKLNSETMLHLPVIKGDVKFDKVSFAYNRAGGYVLKNVSFEAHAGQKIAIVGRSGSGKSTVTNLLLRFFDSSSGTITIDGFNIQHVSIASLRSQIGTVLQDTYLFKGTIRENISLGKPDASFSEIIEATTIAAAHDFIKELPNGYNTELGENGNGLSGGQKQRIAIARALLLNPRILIFDEATSALDNESEQSIQDNLGQITEGRTTFIIAHRLSTVRDADAIIVMDKGYVAEIGSHEELIEKKGIYFYLNSKSLSLS